jgi:hypothetical protein
MFQNHANGPLPDLWGISLLRFHNSILSKVGVSGKPGGIHVYATNDLIKDDI